MTRPGVLARGCAALYPRAEGVSRADTAAFIDDAIADAGARGGWRGRIRLGVELARDIARAWVGRSALRISATPPSLHPPHRRSPRMERWMTDLRFAVRVLRRTPGVAAVAILTLALGIGAATAVYAVVDGAILRPFPYPDMPRLVVMNELSSQNSHMSLSWLNYRDWRDQNDAFEEIGIYRGAAVTLTGVSQPERITAHMVSSQVITAMGIGPLRGRAFDARDDQPEAARVVLISERLWRTRFDADPAIVGRSITLNNEPWNVAGVMPAAMRFPARTTDMWLPLGPFIETFPQSRGAHPGLLAIGRLKPGVSLDQGRASMAAIAKRLSDQYPDTNRGNGANLTSYYELIVESIRPAMYALLGAVGVLLLMACANLAGLMLARADARARELAVRAALGAGRLRLLRQLLIESGLLAVAGGVLGVGLAYAAVRAFVASQPTSVPRIDLIGIDWRVAAFAALASASTIAFFGLLPAMRASRPNLQASLKDLRPGANPRAMRLRRVLVAAQVGLAAVLLVSAGLLGRSLISLLDVDLGFEPSRVVTMRLTLPDARYGSPDAWIAFHRDLLDRMQGLPGVDALGINSAIPLEGGASESGILKEGDPLPSSDRPGTMCLFQTTGGDYFKAMGIPLVRGRLFDSRDQASGGAPVAIIDDTAAAKLFGEENPVGRRIAFETTGDPPNYKPIWREVIGVVSHVRHYGLTTEPPYVQVYTPYAQLPLWFQQRRPAMALIARTTDDPASMIATIRQRVAAIDGQLPVHNVQALRELVGRQIEQPRLSATLVFAFAAIALLLATLGVYGVLSYLVVQRTREIGVRLALGARRVQIIGQIVRQGLVLAGIGLAFGLAAAVGAGRWLSASLVDVSSTDGVTFAVVAVVLVVAALAASLIPARRASAVDPLSALRTE